MWNVLESGGGNIVLHHSFTHTTHKIFNHSFIHKLKHTIMAHNLEIKDGTASFVAVGQTAWHGLGQYVDNAMTADQVIEKARLDYIVEKQPIRVVDGRRIPNMFATVRTDTKDPLGIVTDAYKVIQNHEAFGFFDSIIDRGEAIYQTAGVLGKGEKIFVTAKLPHDITVHGDAIDNYLLLTSGHDGRSAIQAGFTSIRVVCNNTLTAALRGMTNRVSILHFANAKEKLQAAAKVMGMASHYTTELDLIFNKMAKVKITDAELKAYVENVFKPRKETINKETLEAEYSTRFINTVEEILEFAHNHPSQQTDAAKGGKTLWGAYNAATGYFTHLKSYNDQETKMNDMYFKNGSRKLEYAFDVAVSMM